MPRRLLALCALLLCAACSAKQPPLFPETVMRIGVAPFTQPAGVNELLAGYMPDTLPRVEAGVFALLNNDFADLLAEMTSRDYAGLEQSAACMQGRARGPGVPALEYWLAVGQCMGVELLVVPQIHQWQERAGGEMGVESPAAVSIDIFLLDVANGSLLARSRYDEKQRALLDNLMDVGKFVRRSGRWVSAATLAKEGMFKAIKDFGL